MSPRGDGSESFVVLPDPRPTTVEIGGQSLLNGWRCRECALARATSSPLCPRCGGELEPELFGPSGLVWASTVVRVPIPGRPSMFALAYVDLDDGPRVLAHVPQSDSALAVGTVVEFGAPTADGDLSVRAVVGAGR